ncbi:MAG TPA: hypothetical protein VIT92_14125 [Burkholderiaceae bacterium]
MSFDFNNLLQQYLGGPQSVNPNDVQNDFTRLAQSAPQDVIGNGVAEAFRSDQTPPFPQMVGQMFGSGDGFQRAGMLNQLLAGLSPALLQGLGGGLGSILGGLGGAFGGGDRPHITPEQAEQLRPEDVEEIAARAEQQDPSIMDRMGSFYAEHPTLVHTIGSAALAIAMSKIAQRMQR